MRAVACALAVTLALLGSAGTAAAASGAERDQKPTRLAQAEGERAQEGSLEPSYRPREPEPEPRYDTAYFFALTRGVADSTLAPAAKAPLFLFTVPLDVVLLPVAAVAGFF